MRAGDNITAERLNKILMEYVKQVNDIPPDKLTLTTGQFGINAVYPGGNIDAFDVISTTRDETSPFTVLYILDLFQGL